MLKSLEDHFRSS